MQKRPTKLPPLNSLVAFESSARHLSFTRAGQELGITREAVSRKIRILEENLGLSLFVRLYRSLALTEAGKDLHSVVAARLADIECAADRLRRRVSPPRITVTATIAIASFWLTPRLPRFRKIHPDFQLDIKVSDTPLDFLAEGIDLGIQYGSGKWSGLKAIKLFDVNSFPVCSPAYLKQMAPINCPADLLRCTLLYLNGNMHSQENWEWWMAENGIKMPASVQSLRFNSYANVIQAALESQGVALGFSQVIDVLLSRGDLLRPMKHVCFKGLAVYAVVPRNIRLAPSTEKFLDWIIAEANIVKKCSTPKTR